MTGIQQGIQFLHAVVEYGQTAQEIGGEVLAHYNNWANNHKTVIILNGGTTNNNVNKLGTLNNHQKSLTDNKIAFAGFYEVDLGDQLTALAFIIDERVFNKEKYPDFVFTNQTQKTPG